MNPIKILRFALFAVTASVVAFASEKAAPAIGPGALLDQKILELERRLTALESGRVVQVGEKTLKLKLEGNASSWIINPHVYQGRWIIRGFHGDLIVRADTRKPGVVDGIETGFRQENVDFIVCTPAVDQEHVIVRAYKQLKP